MKAHIIRVTAIILIAALLPVTALAAQQRSISDKLVRLHVIAHSDSEVDQLLKLQVRDAVLLAAESMTENELTDSLDELRLAAEDVLRQNGCGLEVHVKFGEEDYGTRRYDSFSLPAGSYRSLRVEIGDGKGHNWWCVLFPPLCFASSEEFYDKATDAGLCKEELELLTGDSQDVQIRFRFLELIQKFAHFLFN